MTKNKTDYYLFTNFWFRFMLNQKDKKFFQNKTIKPMQIKVIPETYERTYLMAVLNYQI